MRPIDSAYDRATAGFQGADPGAGEYALVRNHNGPCSLLSDYASLEDAIDAARNMDTDSAPTELEYAIGYDGSDDRDDAGLIEAAIEAGYVIVASAPAGESWTVLYRQ